MWSRDFDIYCFLQVLRNRKIKSNMIAFSESHWPPYWCNLFTSAHIRSGKMRLVNYCMELF